MIFGGRSLERSGGVLEWWVTVLFLLASVPAARLCCGKAWEPMWRIGRRARLKIALFRIFPPHFSSLNTRSKPFISLVNIRF